MSSDKNLQEMEAGTTQSKTAVNAGAKAADPMQKLAPGAVAGESGSYEDLGGPTPDNYKSDDESAKLKTPGATLKQVRDVVNKGAKPADAMKGMKEEEELESEDVIEEEEEVTAEAEEVVSEEETSEEEVVSEEEESEEEVVAEADETAEEEFDVSEDVSALLEGEDLSEEFQEKARTIFEAALRSKVEEIKEGMVAAYNEVYEERLVEEVTEIKSALTERVDSYLEYVSEEWVTENRLAIDSGLRAEMSESFLSGMKNLFEEHYVSIPEEKYDVLESMVEKLDEMETKLNEQIDANINLNKRLAESTQDVILDQISEGLAVTQKEKLASLAEREEFESEEEYREKLETLKESYFTKSAPAKSEAPQTLSEGVDTTETPVSTGMDQYLRAMGAFGKN